MLRIDELYTQHRFYANRSFDEVAEASASYVNLFAILTFSMGKCTEGDFHVVPLCPTTIAVPVPDDSYAYPYDDGCPICAVPRPKAFFSRFSKSLQFSSFFFFSLVAMRG